MFMARAQPRRCTGQPAQHRSPVKADNVTRMVKNPDIGDLQ